MSDKFENLGKAAEKLGLGHYHRHVFLCLGPDCCQPEVGEAAWDVLKKELKERNLTLCRGPNECYRTKVNCLRVCTSGSISLSRAEARTLLIVIRGAFPFPAPASSTPSRRSSRGAPVAPFRCRSRSACG